MIGKFYVTPDSIRRDSFALGMKVFKDGFKPDFIVALWRGGASIGCHVHELLKLKGMESDHIAIRTSRYHGIDKAVEEVQVHNLGYLRERLQPGHKVLIVDDVFDSGKTLVALFQELAKSVAFPFTEMDVRIATVYYKPARNKTSLTPNYFVHESTQWLVFPHEISDMTFEEIEQVMGTEIYNLVKP